MKIPIKITKQGNTPVFVTAAYDLRLRQVYGGMFSERMRLWMYPAFYPVYDLVLKDFKALNLDVEFSEPAQQFIQQLHAVKDKVAAQELPENLEFKTQPYAHQREGLVHAFHLFRAALFYACGLGKTKIVIDWQRATGCWPLILCPKVVLRVWAAEVARHGINQEFYLIDSANKKGKLRQIEEAKNYMGVVVSYDTARRYYQEMIEAIPYNAIVADESHCIKNPASARTKASLELSKRAMRRLIMSGTPSMGDPRDMYSQLRFLSPAFARENFWKFTSMFCVASPYNKHIITGYKNLDILQQRVMYVALRKTKEECLDLPSRLVLDTEVVLDQYQRNLYNELLRSKECEDITQELVNAGLLPDTDSSVRIPNAAVLINKLLQVTCGFIYKHVNVGNLCTGCSYLRECVFEGIQPHSTKCQKYNTPIDPKPEFLKQNAKKTALIEKLKEILADPANKVIIWGQYIPELNLISESLSGLWNQQAHDTHLKEDNYTYHVQVDGRVTGHAHELVDKFNNDPQCRVYLGQVSTGVGLTLNAANYMIYYSLPWKLGDYEQSKDRNHRVGQERDTVIYRLIGKGTVDESIAQALDLKQSVSTTITTIIVCGNCARSAECFAKKIGIFSDDCMYARDVDRHVTKARPI